MTLNREWIDLDLAEQINQLIRRTVNDKDTPSGRGAATLCLVLLNTATASTGSEEDKKDMLFAMMRFLADLYNQGFDIPAIGRA
jgi:hypothetical protein